MGDNRRLHFPFAAQSLDLQACVPELNQSSSDSSGSAVTIESFRDPSTNAKPGQTMVWTNEKHNSYLDFLEASFVKHLHYSKSLYDRHPQVGMREPCPFPPQPAEGHNSSHQFSILQDGCGQKINYKSNDPFLESTADSGAVLESPRLPPIMSASKSSSTTFPVPRETVVPNDGIHLRSYRNFSGKLAINFEQNPIISSCNHSLDSCTAEVTDQNYLDECQGEKTSSMTGAKRLKMTTMPDAFSSNSQIAPVEILRTIDDSVISCMSSKRGKKKLLSDHPESLTFPKSDIHYFLRES